MPRPMIGKNPKVPLTISIDSELREDIRAKGSGKISNICEKAIANWLGIDEPEETKKDTVLRNIADAEKVTKAEEILLHEARTWARVINNYHKDILNGAKITAKDILNWVLRIEQETEEVDKLIGEGND